MKGMSSASGRRTSPSSTRPKPFTALRNKAADAQLRLTQARALQALCAARGVPLIAAAGLVSRWGRMTLEARPPVPVDKGSAVEELLAGCPAARWSLYAGDDRTDLDAFAAVDIAVAVRSDETPDELLAAADITVDGTDGLAGLLRALRP